MSITRLTTNGLTGTKYDNVSADNYYMEPIATTLLSSAQSTITFSNIPQNYKHLQIRYYLRTANAYQFDFTNMGFNNDSSASFVTHMLNGSGGSATSESFGASTVFYGTGVAPGNTTNASGVFGVGVVDILDYANINKNTTIRCLSGFTNSDSTSGRQVALTSGVWLNTAAVNRIDFSGNGANLMTNSRLSLYGIRG